jgi:hypothetical protein
MGYMKHTLQDARCYYQCLGSGIWRVPYRGEERLMDHHGSQKQRNSQGVTSHPNVRQEKATHVFLS